MTVVVFGTVVVAAVTVVSACGCSGPENEDEEVRESTFDWCAREDSEDVRERCTEDSVVFVPVLVSVVVIVVV